MIEEIWDGAGKSAFAKGDHSKWLDTRVQSTTSKQQSTMSMPHAIILKRPSIMRRARVKRQDITLTLLTDTISTLPTTQRNRTGRDSASSGGALIIALRTACWTLSSDTPTTSIT